LFLLALDPSVSWTWLRKLGYAQSLLAVASVFLTYRLGRSFLDPGWALFAAFLTAVCPPLVVMSTYVLSEGLFGFLLLLALLASVRALRKPAHQGLALLAGLAWGATALVRPTTQYLPALLCLLAFALPRLAPWRRAAALCLLAFVLALVPWLARNATLPAPAAGGSLMVKALAHGSYPDFRYEGRDASYGFPYREDPRAEERARDLRGFGRVLGDDFRAHPLRMLRWYLVGKPLAFLSWTDPQAAGIFIYEVKRSPYLEGRALHPSVALAQAMHPLLAACAVLATLLALLSPRRLGMAADATGAAILLALVLAYAIAVHMLVAPFPRYNLPFRPLMFLLAALLLQAGWRAWRTRRNGAAIAEPALG
jgi:4-amino-4-deoxy-L-arabinose transferase-like glycosyltransferase